MPTPSTARRLPCTVVLSEPSGAPGIHRMRLACPELAASLKPGQFFNLYVPGDPSQLLRLPFSWALTDADAGWVEFSFAVVGDGTRRLAALPLGTECDLLGPAGHGWEVPEGAARALVVAGGTGTVPCVALARELAACGVACDFVEGAATAAAIIYERELTATGATLWICTDNGTRGMRGFTTQAAERLLSENAYDVVYACGPQPMMAGVAKLARAAGVPCQVSMERLMGCGFGACTTCLVDTVEGRKGACMAGPVFDAEKVIW